MSTVYVALQTTCKIRIKLPNEYAADTSFCIVGGTGATALVIGK
jgi:hypothetical protein